MFNMTKYGCLHHVVASPDNPAARGSAPLASLSYHCFPPSFPIVLRTLSKTQGFEVRSHQLSAARSSVGDVDSTFDESQMIGYGYIRIAAVNCSLANRHHNLSLWMTPTLSVSLLCHSLFAIVLD